MGSSYVDGSPGWGSIFGNMVSGIEGAPGKALDNIGKAEQIKALRAKQIRDQAIFDSQSTTGELMAKTLADTTSAPIPDPRTFTAADISNPAVLNAPLSEMGPPNAKMQFIDPVATAELKKRYDAELPAFQSLQRTQAFSDSSKLPEVYAKSRVATGGVPESASERERLQVLMKGSFDKTKGDNYVAVNPETGETLRVLGTSSDGIFGADGRTKLTDLAPSGSAIIKAGDMAVGAAPKTIMDNDASMWNGLVKANNLTIGGKPPDANESRVLAAVLERQFPGVNKIMSDAIGNTIEVKNFQEKNIPVTFQPLVQHIANTLYPAPAAAAAPASPAVTVDPLAAVGASSIPAAPAATAAPAEPVLSAEERLRGGRQQSTNILVAAPATESQVKEARALILAGQARRDIESIMGVQVGPDGKPVLPANAYVPDWISSVANERLGGGTIPGMLQNYWDPKALEFFTTARAAVEPILRVASGAVTPPAEVANYMQMFIPNANDSPEGKARKLTRLRSWEAATATSANANDAIAKIKAANPSDREGIDLAERLRVRATEAGTAATPTSALGGLGSAAPRGPVTAAPAPTPPAPTRGRPGVTPPTASPTVQRGNQVFGE